MVDLYPAIDLRDGKVVRLTKGDYDEQTTYSDDPVAVARSFVEAGAVWIHVVDLDAARSGSPVNRPVVAAISSAVAGRARVQTGGGVRSLDDVRQLAAAGVARVVMGSAAVRQPDLVDEATALIDVAVGLDHRRGEVAVDGWTRGAGHSLDDLLGCYPSARAFVITDIDRDGMLEGPDLDGLRAVAAKCAVPVIASGGVGKLEHLVEGILDGGATGVLAASIFHFGDHVIADAKQAMTKAGIIVRPVSTG